MRCACFRADPAAVVAVLTDPDALARYQRTLAAEIPALADRGMIAHVRRMTALAGRAATEGFDRLAEAERGNADALLSDLLAVATWHGWDLPMEQLGDRDCAVESLPRGLLGADAPGDGAGVWLLGDDIIALARMREAGEP